jgi:two-component system response regulator RegA
MKRVLLIEDDETFRTTLGAALRRRGVEVTIAADIRTALARLSDDPSQTGILLDLRLGQSDGSVAIPSIKKAAPNARLVVLTGYGSIPSAMNAVRQGADDYLLKPADLPRIWAALFSESPPPDHAADRNPPSLARVEWEHIQRVIHECAGNISRAAAALGIDRRTLQRKLNKLPPDV